MSTRNIVQVTVDAFGRDAGFTKKSGHLNASAREHLPFNYESMESAEAALLWFRPVGGDWSVGYSDGLLLSGLELRELERAAAGFVDQVLEEVPRQVGVEVKEVVGLP